MCIAIKLSTHLVFFAVCLFIIWAGNGSRVTIRGNHEYISVDIQH